MAIARITKESIEAGGSAAAVPNCYVVRIDDELFETNTLNLRVSVEFLALVLRASKVERVEFAENCYDLELVLPPPLAPRNLPSERSDSNYPHATFLELPKQAGLPSWLDGCHPLFLTEDGQACWRGRRGGG